MAMTAFVVTTSRGPSAGFVAFGGGEPSLGEREGVVAEVQMPGVVRRQTLKGALLLKDLRGLHDFCLSCVYSTGRLVGGHNTRDMW